MTGTVADLLEHFWALAAGGNKQRSIQLTPRHEDALDACESVSEGV